MWEKGWRDSAWAKLDNPWDLIVVGGGVTGAGIFDEAAKAGARVLLVEQKDFAWGTSSRSSKMVHGGLRYLGEGKIGLTVESVRERRRLLAEGRGLIAPLGFLLPVYKNDSPGRWITGAGLAFYDLIGRNLQNHFRAPEQFKMLAPHLPGHDLKAGFSYGDAQTDDARLVLRVIRQGVARGGLALNYGQAKEVVWEGDQVAGIVLEDLAGDRIATVRARVVINATGAWADKLRLQAGQTAKLRPLKGSHLVFPAWRVPVAQAISFRHPQDRRYVFAFPWEGVTLVGTTDLDHDSDLNEEPAISPQEVSYLMAALHFAFPDLNLTLDDVIASFSGVRPVVGSGKTDPSKESRDYVVWEEKGLLTVTGGKLTTFRSIARHALRVALEHLPEYRLPAASEPVLDPVKIPVADLPAAELERLAGRYGADVPALLAMACPGDLNQIPGTAYLWAELRWTARSEGVVHLDDLLLRRVRLGLLLPKGGADLMDQIREICQHELGWDDARWEQEETAYRALWQKCYSLPDPAIVPDWKTIGTATRKKKSQSHLVGVAGASLALVILTRLLKRKKEHPA